MGTLLTVVSILIALSALVAQFYFKWVPDPEDQKRHVKRVAAWAWNIFTLGTPVLCLFTLSTHKDPITPGFVVEVALVASGLSLTVAFILFRLVFGVVGDSGSGLASITKGVIDALCLLADEPSLSAPTANALRKLLYGTPASKQIKDNSGPN
jgi:hypothetical protein